MKLFTINLLSFLILTFIGCGGEPVAFRASILDFKSDPSLASKMEDAYRYYEDGLLITKNGKVVKVGPYSQLIKSESNIGTVKDYRGKLIMPGFIDTHVHYPQTEMIAAYGAQLLEWLNTYTFPTEKQYKDKTHSSKMSKIFLQELFRNGTTTALVFATVHPESVDALFEHAQKINMRVIAGKVMMDRNAPDYLLDTAETSYNDTKALIKKWHKKDRLLYAITPRFAPTSTPEQLEMAKKLKKEFPDTYVHTHLSENTNEIKWVMSLFPKRKNYLDIYDHYELTSSRSVFAHCIHLSDGEFDVLNKTGSAIAFCPTSNLFLGSGLFMLSKAKAKGVKVGLGSDVGAGTTLSTFMTLNEAYKVIQLQNQKLSAFEGFYLATLGGAKSLELADKIGNFDSGKEADFIVIDFAVTPLQKLRMSTAKNLAEKLFAIMIIGDDRNIEATYINGKLVYDKSGFSAL
ncbi:MAG: guanine deaminase [bacterium]|nr:guanine deaminase [bacterium]